MVWEADRRYGWAWVVNAEVRNAGVPLGLHEEVEMTTVRKIMMLALQAGLFSCAANDSGELAQDSKAGAGVTEATVATGPAAAVAYSPPTAKPVAQPAPPADGVGQPPPQETPPLDVSAPVAPSPEEGMPVGMVPPAPEPQAGMGAGQEIPSPMMEEAVPPPVMRGEGTGLQGTGDFSAMGPYGVAMFDVELPGGLGPYTIFHPQNLEAECPHPIVGWGNGTGVTGSLTYSAYHRHAASWGIVTIAAHNSNAGSMPFIERGLDYLLEQNGDPASPLYGKLSDRAGVSGHSQGGIAASTAARHPNVKAEVCVQGGGFGVGPDVAFMCQTGVEDFLRGSCTSAYRGAAGPSFLLDHQMADHISTPTFGLTTSEPGKQYVRTSTAWFRCWLADDQGACRLFEGGSSAPVCGESDWATCDSRNFR